MSLFRIIIIMTVAMASIVVTATTPESYDPFDLDLENNINTPEVPQKRRAAVKEQIDRIRLSLERTGFSTSRLRQGVALKVTIPCESLFRANESALSEQGRELLGKFSLPSDATGKYKLLVAVHTDNTGEVAYADSITASRANAIDDYISTTEAMTGISVVPYGIGRDEPLNENDSVKKRARNRRVEIYIIPEEALFSKSKTSR